MCLDQVYLITLLKNPLGLYCYFVQTENVLQNDDLKFDIK